MIFDYLTSLQNVAEGLYAKVRGAQCHGCGEYAAEVREQQVGPEVRRDEQRTEGERPGDLCKVRLDV